MLKKEDTTPYKAKGDQYCLCGSRQVRFPVTDDRGNFYFFACYKCIDRKRQTHRQQLNENYRKLKHDTTTG
jgi:hypothetical protein